MLDAITYEVSCLSDRVTAYRFVRLLEGWGTEMARLIEIKGIGADVASIKKGIGELRTAAAGLNTESAALKSELTDLTEQIKEHRKDLRFEAETLGNGNGEDSDKQSETPAVRAPEGQQTPTSVSVGIPASLITGSTASSEPQ